MITDNSAAKVSTLKVNPAESKRRAFTKEELVRLLDLADDEWKGIILFGVYTAQRLGDIVRLRWASVDLDHDTSLVTSKTGRRQILPIAPPLKRWLQSWSPADRGRPLFPVALGYLERAGKVSTLSRQLYEPLATAGLVPPRTHQKRKQGAARPQGQRRVTSNLSFHSLRHTATSLMKNVGISPAIVQEFVGHDSKEISDLYTHIEISALAQATAALPDLMGG